MEPIGSTQSFKSVNDWLPWLESLSPREIVLGLERVLQMLERLNLSRPMIVINVGGTNGKGSSVAILESLLLKKGLTTGCYMSPHLNYYNERIRINGEPVNDVIILKAFERVEFVRQEIPLTFFEFGTLVALVAFQMCDVEAWVLEVGMGGRLDAVNAIEPDAVLITNISLDHCAWLGKNIESIGREKAGLMRNSIPAIIGMSNPPDSIKKVANEVLADLRIQGEDYSYEMNNDDSWNWFGQELNFKNLCFPSLSGSFQINNAAAALAVLESIDFFSLSDYQLINKALNHISLEGRQQIIGNKWILDVAHNPDAAGVLAHMLGSLSFNGKITAIIGLFEDKDVEGFLLPLLSYVDYFIATGISGDRGLSANKMARCIANISNKPCLVIDEIEVALEFIDKKTDFDDRVLVTGSFQVVGPALKWLKSV